MAILAPTSVSTVMEGIKIGVQASPVLQMIQLRNLLHNHSIEHALRNVGGPETVALVRQKSPQPDAVRSSHASP
jgi:hypothetical protein